MTSATAETKGEGLQPPEKMETVFDKARQVVYEYSVMPHWNKGDYKHLFAVEIIELTLQGKAGALARTGTVEEVARAIVEYAKVHDSHPFSIGVHAKDIAAAILAAFPSLERK